MMKEGILITGTSGFVGRRMMEHFKNALPMPGDMVRTGGEGLRAFVIDSAPRYIINCAAISDIGACERDPEGSYKANVLLPVQLAEAANAIGAKLISFSSDQVYTGRKDTGPYKEEEPLPLPQNVYARHKLDAEKRVMAIQPQAVMLRATWMYDMPCYDHSNRGNFLMNTLGAIIKGEELRYSSREYRGITYVRQVVELMDGVLTLPGGVYNYGSENPLSMWDTARALVRALGAADISVAEDDKSAVRSLWMNCDKLKSQGICFDTTAEGFKRCLGDYHII